MATLLNAVNEVLKKAGQIKGSAGELTSLTDDARQRYIDVTVQVVNEGMEQLFSLTDEPHPNEQAEDTITLSTGTRSYTLAADLVQMRWPLIDKTNNQYIFKYLDGYNGLLLLDPEQDDEGLPHFGAISPVDGNLHLDKAPTSTENGRVYTYQYDKDVSVSSASDTLPFPDPVYRAMVPVWAQLVQLELNQQPLDGVFRANFARAARLLTQNQPRASWFPR